MELLQDIRGKVENTTSTSTGEEGTLLSPPPKRLLIVAGDFNFNRSSVSYRRLVEEGGLRSAAADFSGADFAAGDSTAEGFVLADSTAGEISDVDFGEGDFSAMDKSSSINSVAREEVGVVAKKGMGKVVSPAGRRKETFYTEALSSDEGVGDIMSPTGWHDGKYYKMALSSEGIGQVVSPAGMHDDKVHGETFSAYEETRSGVSTTDGWDGDALFGNRSEGGVPERNPNEAVLPKEEMQKRVPVLDNEYKSRRVSMDPELARNFLRGEKFNVPGEDAQPRSLWRRMLRGLWDDVEGVMEFQMLTRQDTSGQGSAGGGRRGDYNAVGSMASDDDGALDFVFYAAGEGVSCTGYDVHREFSQERYADGYPSATDFEVSCLR